MELFPRSLVFTHGLLNLSHCMVILNQFSKINAVALLLTMQNLDPHVLQSRFEFMMKKVIPEVVDSINVPSNAPKIGISPTFRFSENILS